MPDEPSRGTALSQLANLAEGGDVAGGIEPLIRDRSTLALRRTQGRTAAGFTLLSGLKP